MLQKTNELWIIWCLTIQNSCKWVNGDENNPSAESTYHSKIKLVFKVIVVGVEHHFLPTFQHTS